MKKILIAIVSVLFFSASASALEVRVGLSAAATAVEIEGTETLKSTSVKTKANEDAYMIVPSVFAELAHSSGFGLGIDYVTVNTADLGSDSRDREDDETGQGVSRAGAEIKDIFNVYAIFTLGETGLYVKAGQAFANIDTQETLTTGTKYGNKDIEGLIYGAGYNFDIGGSGFFGRVEATMTDFDNVKFTGTKDTTTNTSNTVTADLDAYQARVSIGKSF